MVKEIDTNNLGPIAKVPERQLRRFVDTVMVVLPNARPSQVAASARDVWKRMAARPPGVSHTIGLIFLYGFFVLLGLAAAFMSGSVLVPT